MADTPALDEPGGSTVTLDDIERQLVAEKKPEPVDYDKIKVEIDGLPDTLKGKSVKDVVAHAQRLEEALKLSEKARSEPQQITINQPAPPAPEPPGPALLTREQVQEMMEKDPLGAFEYMANRSAQMMQQNTEARVKPLRDATAAAAEQNAKVRYVEEFQLFGTEIQAIVDKLPDRGALAMPGAWDDVVTYVRGQNVDRLIEHRTAKKEKEAREAAQAIAARNTPTGSLNTTRSSLPNDIGEGELDATRKEIARTLGMSEDDYKKWARA